MAYSLDMRWRFIVLMSIYGIDAQIVATLLGVSDMILTRWNRRFVLSGNVEKQKPKSTGSGWLPGVCEYVRSYISSHLCFYFEELCTALCSKFPLRTNVSDATICRAPRFDLSLSSKIPTKKARESVPLER